MASPESSSTGATRSTPLKEAIPLNAHYMSFLAGRAASCQKFARRNLLPLHAALIWLSAIWAMSTAWEGFSHEQCMQKLCCMYATADYSSREDHASNLTVDPCVALRCDMSKPAPAFDPEHNLSNSQGLPKLVTSVSSMRKCCQSDIESTITGYDSDQG